MGKSAPRAPTPPDPRVVSAAQTESNIATAQANQRLNMINTTDPYGSVTFAADPTAPGGYSQNTTLSPSQQQNFDLTNQAQAGALQTANTQLGRVNDALSQPFSYDGLPALSTGPQSPNLQTQLGGVNHGVSGFDAGPGLRTDPIQGGALPSGIASAGDIRSGVYPRDGVVNSMGMGGTSDGGPRKGLDGTVRPLDPGEAPKPAGRPVAGGLAALGDAALSGNFSPGQNVQGQVAAGGPLASGVNALPVQMSAAGAGPIASGFQNTQVQQQVGPQDFSRDRDNVTNAVFGQARSRLDPMFATRQSQLETKLANQGLGANSHAYQNAANSFGMERSDAYNDALFRAVQAGGAEQSRLFGQELQQGQFANQAAGQQFGQNQNLAGFQNQAQGQQFGQNMAGMEAYNAAQGQLYGQGMGNAQLQNSAQGQQFGQGLQQGQFANTAAAQQYGQNMGLAQFGNDATLAAYGRDLSQAQFGNTAQAQQFGQNAQQAQFQAGMQGQAFDQALAGNQFANQASGQQFAQNQAQADFYNQFGDTQFARNLTAGQFGNDALGNQFNMGLQGAQMNNQTRTQGAQEQAYAQNLPLNQFTALLGLGQVGTPQGVGYTPAQQANTDVLGAHALNAQMQQANYQAAMQRQAGQMSGLFSLGAAALMPSDVRLKRDIVRLGTWKGLNVYAYRYLWSPVRHVGVMAQEVLRVKPEAVGHIGGGFLGVDYAQL